MSSYALKCAQKKVEKALEHLKFVEEREAEKRAEKEKKAKEKAEKRLQQKTDVTFQRNQARSLLLQFCLKLERAYTDELLSEFVRWKLDPASGAAGMHNLYDKMEAFMKQLQKKQNDSFPVMVKTMTGDLISLEYSPSRDRQQLVQQLMRLDSEIFPENQTLVVRIVEDEKEPVCEGEIFGSIVVPPPSLVSFQRVEECSTLDQPAICYPFYLKPNAFHPYRDVQGIMMLPVYSTPVTVVHQFEKNTFSLRRYNRNVSSNEYSSLHELLEQSTYDCNDRYYMHHSLHLTAEAIQEIVQLFQVVRRM